jgi:hypothetical protein
MAWFHKKPRMNFRITARAEPFFSYREKQAVGFLCASLAGVQAGSSTVFCIRFAIARRTMTISCTVDP